MIRASSDPAIGRGCMSVATVSLRADVTMFHIMQVCPVRESTGWALYLR